MPKALQISCERFSQLTGSSMTEVIKHRTIQELYQKARIVNKITTSRYEGKYLCPIRLEVKETPVPCTKYYCRKFQALAMHPQDCAKFQTVVRRQKCWQT